MSYAAYLNPNLTTEDLIRMEEAKFKLRSDIIKMGEESIGKTAALLDSLNIQGIQRADALMQVFRNTMNALSMTFY